MIDPIQKQTFKGIGLSLLSGFSFTVSMIVLKFAFEDGVDLNTSNSIRYVTAAVILILYQKARGKNIGLNPRERNISFMLGIPIFMMGIGYLGAVQYIPLSLAVLIFYTCPFFVAIISKFTEKEPITILRLTALTLGFIGLILALKVESAADLKIQGILFAFTAAIGFASFATISSVMLRNSNRQSVLLHGMASGAVLFVLFFLFNNGIELKGTWTGWSKVAGAGLLIALAYIALFAGIKIIGPVKTTMILNVEPILTIVLAAILFGERFSTIQVSGAVLVIAGIILINWVPKSR